MLTGKFLPSSGDAWLNGLSIKTHQVRVRSQLGYCPQHDALLDRLTVREHLFLCPRPPGAVKRLSVP
jgi:ABC-type multidrug transport system ATPase subunit